MRLSAKTSSERMHSKPIELERWCWNRQIPTEQEQTVQVPTPMSSSSLSLSPRVIEQISVRGIYPTTVQFVEAFYFLCFKFHFWIWHDVKLVRLYCADGRGSSSSVTRIGWNDNKTFKETFLFIHLGKLTSKQQMSIQQAVKANKIFVDDESITFNVSAPLELVSVKQTSHCFCVNSSYMSLFALLVRQFLFFMWCVI